MGTQPSLAVGGEAFGVQPVVNFLDDSGNLDSTFTGFAYATIQESLTGFESLWYDGSSTNTDNMVAVVDGRATFSGLTLNEAGSGYKLRFIGLDSSNTPFAYVDSQSFACVVGTAYQISIARHPASATGGSSFRTQPVVNMEDRGGNVLTTFSGSETVTVSMYNNNDVALRTFVTGGLTANFYSGVASFGNLYINEAGGPYTLQFTYSGALSGISSRLSYSFTVGVGAAASLTFQKTISSFPVYGGQSFKQQPKLTLVDAGGNTLIGDSTSQITVSIFDNPANSVLAPTADSTVTVLKGIVTFNNLFIDKAGLGFSLKFDLVGTLVTVLSTKFDVLNGPVSVLSIAQAPEDAWAGGQPFQTQPHIELQDYGGNVITTDSVTSISCVVVPSLASTNDLVVTTTTSPPVNVTNVKYAAATLEKLNVESLGPGDNILVDIEFSHEVTATYTSTAPYLELTHDDAANTRKARAVITNPNTRTKTLTFQYTIGSDLGTLDVGFFGVDALKLGDGAIKDNLLRPVNDTFRINDGTLTALRNDPGTLNVSPDAPKVQKIESSIPRGEYGAGHKITLDLNFTRSVQVTGTPKIPLMVNQTVNVIRTNTTGNITAGSTFDLTFGTASRNNIPFDVTASQLKTYIEGLASVSGTVCVMREDAYALPWNIPGTGGPYDTHNWKYEHFRPFSNGNGYNWVVQFNSLEDDPSLGFTVDYSGMSFSKTKGPHNGDQGTMLADTVEIGKADSQYATYDVSTDAVTASYDHTCLNRFAYYSGGSGTSDLRFDYVIMPGDQATFFDINPGAVIELDDPTSDTIYYNAPTPVLAADLGMQGQRLAAWKDITIDTSAPSVDMSVGVVAYSTPDATYTVGDTLKFTVKFTKPVAVSASATLDMGLTGTTGNAIYESGSGTDTLVFAYTVTQFQTAADLDYLSTSALSAGAGTIRRDSTTPTTDVVLTLPNVGTHLSAASNIVIEGDAPVISSIAPKAGVDSNTYNRGATVDIELTWSQSVELTDGPPVLLIDVGTLTREAVYVSGTGTNVYLFRYTVMTGDTATNLGYSFSASALCYETGCPATTTATLLRSSTTPTAPADITTSTTGGTASNGVPIGSAIVIDTSGAPTTTIQSIAIREAAGTYAVGSVMFVDVTFTDEVLISSGRPSFYINLGGGSKEISFSAGDGTDTFSFYFTVAAGDAVANLKWVDFVGASVTSPFKCEASDSCVLVNRNSAAIDHTIGAASQFVDGWVIDETVPIITRIYSNKTTSPYCGTAYDINKKNCTYTVGEEIDINVLFSAEIAVAGEPRLKIETGDTDKFLTYNQAKTTNRELVFTYVVAEGDVIPGNLTYVCESPRNSQCLLDMAGGTASVKRKSTVPTTDVNYTMPLPGPEGVAILGQYIYIDVTEFPKVANVGSITSDGTYYPGDVVTLYVDFTEVIVVTGTPILHLELGNLDSYATYVSGSDSRRLLFEYTVEPQHFTLDLDYSDAHSLKIGIPGAGGTMLQKSTTPTVVADMTLPYASTAGSLGANAAIQIDGTTPYITAVTSPQVSAEYGDGSLIQIYVNFSSAVFVSGNPFLVLETGTVDRQATYFGGSNTSRLEFRYYVTVGDESGDLDYMSVENDFRDATSSFQLNGGSIKKQSSHPRLDADIHLNPGKGEISGTTTVQAVMGEVRFSDLMIKQRGPNYKLRFSATAPSGQLLKAESSIYVDVSSEYEIMGLNREVGDRFGYSVDISPDVLVVGAPGKRNPIYEVQILDIFADTPIGTPKNEVQIFETECDLEEAIRTEQIITSYADPHETVGGFFSLDISGYGNTIQLPVDIAAESLATFVEEMFPFLGAITASRTVNTWCACNNAYEWTVTFLDSTSMGDPYISTFNVDSSLVTGAGGGVSQPRMLRERTFIEGFWAITNPNNGMKSRDLSANATEYSFRKAIEDDLGLGENVVVGVSVGNKYNFEKDVYGLGRRWKVTFSKFQDADEHMKYDIPNLQVDGTSLTGSGAYVWTAVGVDGKEFVNGNFTVSLRGSNPSAEIPADATAGKMESLLEASVDSINDVTVVRSSLSDTRDHIYGYSYTITFVSVNEKTDYGWEYDKYGESSSGNLPQIEIGADELYGSNAGYKVSGNFGWGTDENSAWFEDYRMGSDSKNSGQVQVNRKDEEQWVVEATLKAGDSNGNDHFGHSVSVHEDYLLVGAPHKEVNGNLEQQMLNCTAKSGTFTIKFRGFESAPISHDATIDDLRTAVRDYMNPLKAVQIDPLGGWNGLVAGGRGLCSGNHSVLFTFRTPGGGNSAYLNTTGDIEMLQWDETNLHEAHSSEPNQVEVKEITKGTIQLNGDFWGMKASGMESGAVYLFKRFSNCAGSICSYWWSELKKLTPYDSGAFPQDSQMFGQSVYASKSGSIAQALIGSPGADESMGSVYFYRDLGGGFTWRQTLSADSWGRNKGDMFGFSLASHEMTLAVSAPGYNSREGAVYIWRGHDLHPQFNYNPDQMITAPAGEGITSGDEFGCSVDVFDTELVICACKSDNDVIYTKTDYVGTVLTDTGSCFVYERVVGDTQFRFREKLVPTNLKKFDNFGKSVSIVNGTIAVGQVVDFTGGVGTTRPQQEIVTYCDDSQGACTSGLGAKFRLSLPKDVEGGLLFTRGLSYHSSGTEMRQAIEEDLGLGEVAVTRSTGADANKGYRWRVTFNSFSDSNLAMSSLMQLGCNTTTMTGSFPACTTSFVNPIRNSVRSKVHVFSKDFQASGSQKYTEQCFLFPNNPQRQDMVGANVALTDNYAIVGGWNRDLTNINSGAALAFDTSFLDFKFQASSYSVQEGNEVTLKLSRVSTTERRVVGVRTLDKNAPQAYQNYVNSLFNVRTQEIFPIEKTIVDEISGPTAFGRSQYYGGTSNGSIWVDSVIDYRGISDYELLDQKYIVGVGDSDCDVVVKTTNDNIFEAPDENITVQFSLPGIFPSQIGNLRTVVTVSDDDDGVGPYDLRTYYEKFYSSDIEKNDAMGSSVDVDDTAGIMVVGSQFATYTSGTGVGALKYEKAGAAYIFNRTSGMWSQSKVLRLPHTSAKANALFGSAVAVSQPYGRKDVTVVVGAPGIKKAFVYVFNWNGTHAWTLQETLETSEKVTDRDHFAGFRSVAISGDIIAIGCRGLESVHVYYRTWDSTNKKWDWSAEQILRSSEYDYDVYDNQMTKKHVHRQDFGVSVAMQGRTMIVGAPYADYGKGGTAYVDAFDTDGTYNVGLGKGKVFSFYSRPIIQKIAITAGAEPTKGTFKLGFVKHAQTSDNSTSVEFDASAAAVKSAIEASENIGEVSVSRTLTTPSVGWGIYWTVTFLTEYDGDLPLMTASYAKKDGYNCSECVLWDTTFSVEVEKLQDMTSMSEFGRFQAEDKKSGDRFGYSVAIDGNQAVVGAMFSAGKCRATFDFETGDMVGWTKTGTAFDFQPTYGDNSKYRNVYGGFGDKLTHGASQSSGIEGRYYIGTFEKRPGSGRDNYLNPDPTYSAGSSQGDAMEGTLTSDSFIILGDTIDFLIGGGCNHLTVYMELLIDGMSVMRSTGKCAEKMEPVTWEVGEYLYRAGQIRIVDAGSGPWDHINVDDIRLSWAEIGGVIEESGQKQQFMLQEGAAKAGCAYTFRMKESASSLNYCPGNKDVCVWEQEERLVASDKRKESLFGYNVDVDDATGHAVVGAVGMVGMGVFKEVPSAYPHYKPTRLEHSIASKYEIYAHSGGTQAASGGGSVRLLSKVANVTGGREAVDENFSAQMGAMYVFTRRNAAVDGSGNVVLAPVWKNFEDVKIYAPDGFARDKFGYDVALDGYTSVVGAIGVDGKGADAGAAYVVDTEFQRVYFSKGEFVALEGVDSSIQITVMRDGAYTDSILTVGYAVSDLTATGVDSVKFAACEANPASQRDGCGDYELSSGEITFTRGSNSAVFTVKIMNDFCKERYMEYAQLSLSIPGGGALSGDGFLAVLRIDDNDWEGSTSSMTCNGGIS
ncbi:hypothetical protein TrRE_jg8633 [Triparma retinervis]|uniref:Uncharacterized protein n=1 Tax=Triparma retinervis TaxID=2557542 RepID=A0A9W7CBQ8_9STRA|nr:hypothetical protein TrRE_jg8633 [Triparma retinervis]